MTGVIFDLKKFAVHDGPGIRTTVFFKGCPLKCRWCHNPEGRHPELQAAFRGTRNTGEKSTDTTKDAMIGRTVSVQQLMREIKKDEIFYDQSGGGVTFSGGEPMMQIDFLFEILTACRKEGIATAVDTCGFTSYENFTRILPLVDLFLYDIKLIDDRTHKKYAGQSNRVILENLEKLSDGEELQV